LPGLFENKSSCLLWKVLHCLLISRIYCIRCDCVPEISSLSVVSSANASLTGKYNYCADVRFTILSGWSLLQRRPRGFDDFHELWVEERNDFFIANTATTSNQRAREPFEESARSTRAPSLTPIHLNLDRFSEPTPPRPSWPGANI
jgi:hypothetical protein